MTAVMVEIRPTTPRADDEPDADTEDTDAPDIEFIADMNKFFEHNMCSCSASDDNPY